MIERQLVALLSTAYVFAAYLLWRFVGIEACGDVLITALSYQNETSRTVAAILLVKSPDRAKVLLKRAMAERHNLKEVLRICGEIADETLEEKVRSFMGDPDPQVSKAAHEAIHMIVERKSHSTYKK
jgi:hypothetical protein